MKPLLILILTLSFTLSTFGQNATDTNFTGIKKVNGVDVNFVHGRANGVIKEYYDDGKLAKESTYSMGYETGIEKEYYEDGKLKSEVAYSTLGEKGLAKEYYESGETIGQDSLENSYDNLKKGYKLIFKETDSMDYVLLQHDKQEIELDSYNHKLLNTGLEIDGENYFMISQNSYGAGVPRYLDVYEKKSENKVFSTTEAFILYEDTLNSIIVFDDQSKNKGFFTLYKLNTNTYELYKKPTDNPCNSYDCWDSVVVTNKTLKVFYKDTVEKARTVEYSRKQK